MLRMAQKEYIKDLYENEEVSLREISRITGHSFQTVRKYAYQEDWSEEHLPNIEPEKYPVLKDFIPIIDRWLEEDRKIPRKQRHTIQRIHDRLWEEYGFTGSYSSVKKYVRKKKYILKMAGGGYLPLVQPQGCGQVDFGEFLYYDTSGRERKGYALTVSFPYSNKGYTQAFPSQNQECLLEGLKHIFERIGGVPMRLRFDNMAAVVARIQEGGNRVLTEGFQRFMLHYRFQAEFCNPASGNEKGNVENKVGYSRRNALVPVPTITSFEEFNEYLWEWCEKDAEREHYRHKVSIRELWEEERSSLLVLPEHPFPVFRYAVFSVNKYGFVTVENNRYGLNPELFGKTIQAKLYYDHIEFFYDHHLEGRYKRSYGSGEEICDWTKYVTVLCRKPGAAEHTRFFHQLPALWQSHLKQTHGKDRKKALFLLDEIVTDGNASVCDDVLELAHENGRMDADSIRQYYYTIARKEFHPHPLQLEVNTPTLHYHPDLSAYDGLMGGEADA